MRKLTQQSIDAFAHTNPSDIIGRSIPHESAPKQVSGEALFVDDRALPAGTLHAAVITSPAVKGQLHSSDFSSLLAQDGVHAVLTIDDVPGHRDIGAIFEGDPLLAEGEIKFHHQPVALVLATSHHLAWQVAKQGQALLNISATDDTAIQAEQAQQRPHLRDAHVMQQGGEMQAAMDAAALTLSGEQHVGGQEHFYLEGQIALAEPTEDRGILVYSSSQHPTEVQKLVAEVLGVPFNLVTVDMRRMGGGFGGKETQAAQWACLASLGAWYTKQAVKLRLPRSVDMAVTGKRHPFYNRYQLGLSADGVIEASNIEVNGLCGHSPDLSDAIVDRAMFHSDNAYALGAAKVTGNRLHTDTVSHTAYRGFGGPQGMMIIEQAMEDIAIATQQDALDVRYKNLYRQGANTTHYGMEVTQHEAMKTLMQRLEESSDYRARRKQVDEFNNTNTVFKKGLSLSPVKFGISFTATFLNQAGALMHIYTDGSIQVNHGGTEMGQGLHTKIQQIVAQTLDVPLDYVLVTATRTDKVPNTSPTAASSGADLNGMAAHIAAQTLRERLLDFAAEHYQVPREGISIQQGQVILSEQQSIAWTDVVQQAYMARVQLSTTGFYQTPEIFYDREQAKGRPFYYFALGASCSEVTIDTLTGEMRLDRVDILHDVGRSLNPALDIGQIEGAYIQGMGWLTTEELVWHEDGRFLSQSPMNYKIPTIGDYPKEMNIALFDQANPEHSIFRSKAVGEPPFMLAIGTWCAIRDAVAAVGKHQFIPELAAPATGEQILKACLKQQQASIAKGEQDA